tara:strand:+ start:1686 stop:3032 length:1347 start_codon:yes stop_codon:yes gene_type:complete
MSTPQSTPQRTLGLWRATSLVTGNIVGAGLLMLPASLGVYGVTGLLGWGLTTVGAIFLAIVFARLAKRHPKTGGPYAYSREAFGDFVGFQMAWSYWIGNWASTAGLGTAFVSYLSIFFPILKTNLELSFLVGAGVVWLLTFINISGVKNAGILQLATTILKVIPLAAIGIFGIFYINPEHFDVINPSNESFLKALGTVAALTLYSFLGLESATIPAGDVKDPQKTIPRATILGTIIAAVIYIWTMTVIIGIISPLDLSSSHAPFAEAAGIIFGNWAIPLISVSALIAIFGTLNGWTLIQAQVPKAAADDNLFPKIFAKTTAKGTPYISLLISGALMTGILYINNQASLIDQFTTIAIVSTFAVLLPYLYSSLAELYFLVTKPRNLTKAQYARSLAVGLIAFAYTIVITAGAGESAVFMGMIFVFSGFPFYVWMKAQSKKKPPVKSSAN